MEKSCDVLVVGAGIVGAAVAYRLGQAGMSVMVVDRNLPGTGTSGSTFSWLNSLGKAPREYHVLNLRSIGEHRALAEEVGSQDCLHMTGSFAWVSAPTKVNTHSEMNDDQELAAGESRHLEARVDLARRYGYHVEEVDSKEVQLAEPDVAVPPTITGQFYYMPGEGWLDAQGTAHRLLRSAIHRYKLRVEFHASVVELTVGARDSHAEVGLQDGRRLAADVVINCAGPSAQRVAALAGATLPIQRVPGVVFVTDSQPIAVHHVVQDFRLLSLRPDGSSRVLLHCSKLDSEVTEASELSGPVAERMKRTVLSIGAELVPRLAFAGVASVRVGVRPVPEDGVAVVGFDPMVPRLYHVVTHSGATLSAILGRLVTDDIISNGSAELEPFRPDRFAAGVGA